MQSVPAFSPPGSAPVPPASILQVNEMLGVEIPLPALQRGWLHSRELILAWDVARIGEQIGDGCWFSHYARSNADAAADGPDPVAPPRMRPYAVAGYWPGGGFIELRTHGGNPLEERMRSTLCVYADTPAAATALLAELFANYRQAAGEAATQPRIGLLNYSCDSLSVERIPVTAQQIVARDRVDLYYGDGANAWLEDWLGTLNARRYGLTVLTGDPGTGKTTLLRSLAHWLAATHILYFMPAARFASVESGEVVTFWADENRNSRLRKILILEDAESVLLRRAEDNREKVATLLNLTDGMLGDALGLHVVCTLNSQLAELDPALLRPGRLVAHREFDLLTRDEAQRLAAALNLPGPTAERTSLAQLLNPTTTQSTDCRAVVAPSQRRSMGFHTLLPAASTTA